MPRVLIVDDEDCVLRSTAILLESEGYSTVCVLNGIEAEKLVNSQEFDLVITDLRMGPMDGMQLITSIMKTKPDMPIIVISAFGSDETQDQAIRLGAKAYVKKPFTVDDILAACTLALGKA